MENANQISGRFAALREEAVLLVRDKVRERGGFVNLTGLGRDVFVRVLTDMYGYSDARLLALGRSEGGTFTVFTDPDCGTNGPLERRFIEETARVADFDDPDDGCGGTVMTSLEAVVEALALLDGE